MDLKTKLDKIKDAIGVAHNDRLPESIFRVETTTGLRTLDFLRQHTSVVITLMTGFIMRDGRRFALQNDEWICVSTLTAKGLQDVEDSEKLEKMEAEKSAKLHDKQRMYNNIQNEKDISTRETYSLGRSDD